MIVLKKKRRSATLLLFIIILLIFGYWQNNDLVLSEIACSSEKIDQAFDGFKILQVSDLHNTYFGDKQQRLIEAATKSQPDIIVITGDLLDSRHDDIEGAIDFARAAVDIAPTYFVTGNHEAASNQYQQLLQELDDAGVFLLDNQQIFIERGDSRLTLVGVADPLFATIEQLAQEGDYYQQTLDNLLAAGGDNFSIVLAHRPEDFALYVKSGADLVFCGHAHGGQVRIPLIGGVYSPGQGLWPEYTSGFYSEENTTMVVSRGLGNSLFPIRVFNRPQLLLLTLHSEDSEV